MGCPHLEAIFPKLAAAGYVRTSDETGYPPTPGAYNCIAWAAGDVHHFWWPQPDCYWPVWAERVPEISAFVQAFRWLGYRVCDNARLEFAYEKVALYAIGVSPKHMARQLRDGTWTSKIGGAEDINHFTLDAVESFGPPYIRAEYGSPVLYMKRLVVLGWAVRSIQFLHRKIEWTLNRE